MESTQQVAPAAPAASAPATEPVQTPASGGQPSAPSTQEPPKETITKHSRLQSRFDELTRQRYEEQRAHEATRAELDALKRAQTQSQQFSELDSQRPSIDKFNSLEEYNLALADWSTKRAVAMATAEWEKRVREQGTQQAQEFARQQQEQFRQQQIGAAIEDRMEAGRKKYPDFMEAVGNPELPPIRQHPMLLGALMNCQNAHDIAYSLAKNPGEYERFYAMRNPFQIARELFALDQKFSGSEATTQAPNPPPRLNGSQTGQKEWKDMGTEEHAKAYWARKRR